MPLWDEKRTVGVGTVVVEYVGLVVVVATAPVVMPALAVVTYDEVIVEITSLKTGPSLMLVVLMMMYVQSSTLASRVELVGTSWPGREYRSAPARTAAVAMTAASAT
jgi:hypothetical protein